eukprot:TRINITY_DN2012_c0_g1_i4.p2 TRINITY_DN2012_c0_g1~~TRINITY_DN2012_c0_g1_i4.p2  ORF type:complete len:148 (+),score=25.23 TRINITY_DN2012_c0_g1_i4:122-565(+)
MIRRPPRSTHCISSAASDVYKRQSTQSTWVPSTSLNKSIKRSLSLSIKVPIIWIFHLPDSNSIVSFIANNVCLQALSFLYDASFFIVLLNIRVQNQHAKLQQYIIVSQRQVVTQRKPITKRNQYAVTLQHQIYKGEQNEYQKPDQAF